MSDIYIRKYWDEEDILYYLHYKNGDPERQIEISNKGIVFLSSQKPIIGDSELADQSIDSLKYSAEDVITKEEFEEIWKRGF